MNVCVQGLVREPVCTSSGWRRSGEAAGSCGDSRFLRSCQAIFTCLVKGIWSFAFSFLGTHAARPRVCHPPLVLRVHFSSLPRSFEFSCHPPMTTSCQPGFSADFMSMFPVLSVASFPKCYRHGALADLPRCRLFGLMLSVLTALPLQVSPGPPDPQSLHRPRACLGQGCRDLQRTQRLPWLVVTRVPRCSLAGTGPGALQGGMSGTERLGQAELEAASGGGENHERCGSGAGWVVLEGSEPRENTSRAADWMGGSRTGKKSAGGGSLGRARGQAGRPTWKGVSRAPKRVFTTSAGSQGSGESPAEGPPVSRPAAVSLVCVWAEGVRVGAGEVEPPARPQWKQL